MCLQRKTYIIKLQKMHHPPAYIKKKNQKILRMKEAYYMNEVELMKDELNVWIECIRWKYFNAII